MLAPHSAALLARGGVTRGYYLAYAAPHPRAQPSARSDYVTDINDYGSFLARKRGYDEIEGLAGVYLIGDQACVQVFVLVYTVATY